MAELLLPQQKAEVIQGQMAVLPAWYTNAVAESSTSVIWSQLGDTAGDTQLVSHLELKKRTC